MDKKEKALIAINELEKLYPDAICSLVYNEPLQLLIATRLAAQCTDARVNIVTPHLFGKYPDLESFCNANVSDVEEIVKSCGFFRQKAKDIVGMCKMIQSDYNGIVPDTVEELIKLPGVGRKTANLVVGDIYRKPAIVCDTHCIRITNRLGLTTTKDPYKVEMQLKGLLPPHKSNDFCHRLVLFGRDVCNARSPKCSKCYLEKICEENKK